MGSLFSFGIGCISIVCIPNVDIGNEGKHPVRSTQALIYMLFSTSFYKLVFWVVSNIVTDLYGLFAKLAPLSLRSEYQDIPKELRGYVYFARKELRKSRWVYFLLSSYYQLELTHAQIPIQRFGKYIENLMAILCLCTHASKLGSSEQKIATFYTEVLKNETEAITILKNLSATQTLRTNLKNLLDEVAKGENTFIADIKPQQFAHDWRE